MKKPFGQNIMKFSLHQSLHIEYVAILKSVSGPSQPQQVAGYSFKNKNN
jgi:hypothetical protein